jgi:hypothetical protein
MPSSALTLRNAMQRELIGALGAVGAAQVLTGDGAWPPSAALIAALRLKALG